MLERPSAAAGGTHARSALSQSCFSEIYQQQTSSSSTTTIEPSATLRIDPYNVL